MTLVLPTPERIGDEQEQSFAAIQAWAGKKDAEGSWHDVTIGTADLAMATGDSFVHAAGSAMAYQLLGGQSMRLSLRLSGTLTITTGATVLRIRIPDGYQAVPGGRGYGGAGWFNVAGVVEAAFFNLFSYDVVSGSTTACPYVEVLRAASAVFTTGTITINGQITFQTVPR